MKKPATVYDLLRKDPPMESVGGCKMSPQMADTVRRLTPKGHFPSETIRAALELGLPKLAKSKRKKRNK